VTTAAAHLRITRVTLSRVLNGKAGISAAMASRLAAALGHARSVDEYAVTIRLVAGTAGSATGSAKIRMCRGPHS
jgi:hypothetical protein